VMGKLLSTNDAPSGQLPFTDGALVTADMFPSAFPYLNPPLAGSPNDLSVTITLQKSSAVTGPYVDTPAAYNSTSSTLSTSRSGNGPGFYRAKADLPGVRLGAPVVSGTNVLIGLQAP
jgi:hypothetical protein